MSDFTYNPPRPPEISDERLAELVPRIKPVVERNAGLFYIEDVDPRNIAFSWSPKITEKAVGLVEVAQVNTKHTYGAPAFFKPSVAEVLAQIPERYIDEVVAFKIDVHPDQFCEGRELHLAITTLYCQG